MNIGILTTGAPCPGIRHSAANVSLWEQSQGNNVMTFDYGWKGLNENDVVQISEIRPSHEPLVIDYAQKTLENIDRLYCFTGNEGLEPLAELVMRDDIKTNFIAIPKTVENDMPHYDPIGNETARVAIEDVINQSVMPGEIVFVEVPPGQINHVRNPYITDFISDKTKDCVSRHVIQSRYEYHRHSIVLVSKDRDYSDIVKYLQKNTDAKITRKRPNLIREPCLYDCILAERAARESFHFAQEKKDFIWSHNVMINIV